LADLKCSRWAKFVIPETANKTVEEMDILFKDQLASNQAGRMAEINQRIGLSSYHSDRGHPVDDKGPSGMSEHVEEVA
jgi:hypothetical protein